MFWLAVALHSSFHCTSRRALATTNRFSWRSRRLVGAHESVQEHMQDWSGKQTTTNKSFWKGQRSLRRGSFLPSPSHLGCSYIVRGKSCASSRAAEPCYHPKGVKPCPCCPTFALEAASQCPAKTSMMLGSMAITNQTLGTNSNHCCD